MNFHLANAFYRLLMTHHSSAICIVIDGLGNGGAEKLLIELIQIDGLVRAFAHCAEGDLPRPADLPDHVHVSYINSSAEHKALSDWIVTSRDRKSVV